MPHDCQLPFSLHVIVFLRKYDRGMSIWKCQSIPPLLSTNAPCWNPAETASHADETALASGRVLHAWLHACRCVLRMEGHCLFINNCVGQGNQAHFLRFCGFMAVGSLYGVRHPACAWLDAIYGHLEIRMWLHSPWRLVIGQMA